MGVIQFDIAALLILSVNLYLFFSRSRLFIRQTRLFARLLLVTTDATVLDIVCVLMYRDATMFPPFVHYAMNMLFYCFQNTLPFVFMLFILALSGRYEPSGFRKKILASVPWMMSIVLILSTPLTGFSFRFDESLRYLRGPGLPFLYAVAFLYIAVSIVILIGSRERFTREIRITILLFLPFSVIPVFIQFFFPDLLIQNFGVAIAELLILQTIQDVGRFLEPSSGLFNSTGLVMHMEMLLRRKERFAILLVQPDSTGLLRHALGPYLFGELERSIARGLFGTASPDSFAARTGPAQYAWILSNPARIAAERERLTRFFREPLFVHGRSIHAYPFLCDIRVPENTEDISTVFQAQQRLSRAHVDRSPGTLLSLDDFSLAATGRQHEIAQAVRKALSGPDFDIFYQPIVRISTNRVESAEALIRLHTKELGWIPPGEFVPISEQNGTIHRIGTFISDRACGFLSGLRNEPDPSLAYLDINLSPSECIQSNLAKRMLALTERYGVPPEKICFEVTETGTSFSRSLMIRNLIALSDAGFRLAVDDFGTGYSNIEILMDLPFRTVKFDRSMIASVDKPRGRDYLEGIVSLFNKLDVDLVVEGVETEAQLEIVRAMGIDLVQGYYYAAPMPEEAFSGFLREKARLCT